MSGYWIELRNWVLRDPGKLIRYVVLFACCIVVIVQLYECFWKLRKPPISTHSYFNLNESVDMPAVTICREPPYRADVLGEIFDDSSCYHPKYTKCWDYFPYGEVPLDDVFINGTFGKDETFQMFGYNGEECNLDLSSSIHFNLGRCYTLKPKFPLKRVSKNTGYSLMLMHNVKKIESYRYEAEPGWHIYVHDADEEFTEMNIRASGRVEYVFAEIDEEVEIKVQVQHFRTVARIDEPCNNEEGYSDMKCEEACVWDEVTETTNCTGPWMPTVDMAPCDNSDSMKKLTVSYQKQYGSSDDSTCKCMKPCASTIFSTYVQNRKDFIQPTPTTQVWIYYTSKLVSMVEDRHSYDSTQFIADVGGTLGFLLGLSVLGLIGILESLTLLIFGGIIKKIQLKEEKRIQEQKEKEEKEIEESQSNNSTDTIDIASITKNKF